MLRLGLNEADSETNDSMNEADSETKEVSTVAKIGIAFVCLWVASFILQVVLFTLIYFIPDGGMFMLGLGCFAFPVLIVFIYQAWVDRLEAIEEAGRRFWYSVSIILTFIAAVIIWGVVRALTAG